jgi:hypothetical protein
MQGFAHGLAQRSLQDIGLAAGDGDALDLQASPAAMPAWAAGEAATTLWMVTART